MDLLPRIHIMADLSREKVRTQRTQEMVVATVYLCSISRSPSGPTQILYNLCAHALHAREIFQQRLASVIESQ